MPRETRQLELDQVEVPTPLGAVKISGFRSILGVILVVLLLLPIAGFYMHSKEMEKIATSIERSALTYARAQDRMIIAIRWQACINTQPLEARQQQLNEGSFCDRISRIGSLPPGDPPSP